MITKNSKLDITIVDMTNEGEGIGKVDGFPLFVKDAVVGDRVKVTVTKLKKNYGYAHLDKIIKKSPDRVEPACPVSKRCGGCSLQHLSYDAQLKFKYNKVVNCLKRIAKISEAEDKIKGILGMNEEGKSPENYRNKAQFPVGISKDNNIITGFYAMRSHEIIDYSDCKIQHPSNYEILETVKDFMKEYNIPPYDEVSHTGIVRHVVTRVAISSQEIMVSLVINANSLAFSDELVERLSAICGVTSISINVNMEKTNRIMGDKTVTLYGEDYIIDSIGDVKYQIQARSFYQVNPLQTKVLYSKALEYADLTGNEIVWDLYCGIGTISLFLAKKAKHVYGVEIVPEAIDDAKANAKLNGIENTTFYVGKAEEVLPREYEEHNVKADVIVVDPPRKGCDIKALETIVKINPKRVVYVSCDPATLARDIKWLGENGYELVCGEACDMFPHTTHVESIALLQRLSNTRERTITLDVEMEDYHRIKEGERL
ncbi:MAG: 23S rRNA (uracil(1939)-C(5))-methyltransferase RlmD [Lachnospiraceae bacterium]|nr:23S rRNA (uracil(1939)-C(5))-methyltransferase RlmD [Lachnospiraceae bacterium]